MPDIRRFKRPPRDHSNARPIKRALPAPLPPRQPKGSPMRGRPPEVARDVRRLEREFNINFNSDLKAQHALDKRFKRY